ncbi:hypothetical protein V1264_018931 [Littorina saxatilis]|uniref:Hexosyltransferase n=1 Tax=Littorina saxatilis TaxID=31220 RepID=A0AAN9BJ87_9CAEN
MSKYTWVVSTAIAVCVAMSAYVLHLYSKEKPELLVGVCILSARDHQKERNTIRNTWLKADMGSSLEDRKIRIHVKFVVGMEPCLIPPADRLSTFECKEWIPDISADLTKDFEAFSVMEDFVTGPKVHVLNIKALHQVTLKRIGILADITLKEEPLNVSLYDDLTEQELGEVIFSLKDPGIIHKGYRYQPIQPLQVDVVGQTPFSA